MSAVVDIFSGASLEKRKAAHALREMGLRVFPLVPGTKRPLVKRFYEVATTDPQQIDIWWPPGSENNIGIATDDLVVVDIDFKDEKDGLASYIDLGLPLDTRMARTASGGWHAIMSGPSKACTVGKLGLGLDTRGYRGFIVGVGSTIGDKAYVWDNDAPILPAPPEIVAKLDNPRERSDVTIDATELNTDAAVARVIKFLETEAGTATEGQGGNLATYKLANACMDTLGEHALRALAEEMMRQGPIAAWRDMLVRAPHALREIVDWLNGQPIEQRTALCDEVFGPAEEPKIRQIRSSI